MKDIQFLMGDSTLDVILNVYAKVHKEEAFQQGMIASERIQNLIPNCG